MLADAANAADGKQNILGAGVREIRLPELPALVPVTLVGQVIGEPDEYGDHRLVITIEGPEGRQTVVDDEAVRLGGPAPTSNRPGLNIDVKLFLRFEKSGERVIRARYANKRASWPFIVTVAADGDSEQATFG